MKMAKASEADLEMAMELCGAIDALTNNWPTLPAALESSDPDDRDTFDRDDDEQCGEVLRYLLSVADRASLMRVVWGCAVMLDPRNKLVDPDADTIERHPDVAALQARIEALEADAAKMRRAGAMLSNIAFNLAQWEGKTITRDICDSMRECRLEWDRVVAAAGAGKKEGM